MPGNFKRITLLKYLDKIKGKLKKKKTVRRLSSCDAYRLWSAFYDDQPDNVVLYLEEKLFTEMISAVYINNKNILDIGCGTGRHWREILDKKPVHLTGVDNSKEMLNRLIEKFPGADVAVSENNLLEKFRDKSFDMIISTLTIGHIKDIEKYFKEWDRVLVQQGDILITDFHPEAFSTGMKRSFPYKDELIEVENYLYDVKYLRRIFSDLKWDIINTYEKIIDDEVRHLFEKQNFMAAYNRYFETPLISGIHLKKS